MESKKEITYRIVALKAELQTAETKKKLIEDVEKLELWATEDYKKDKLNKINFLMEYCTSRQKAHKLLVEIQKGYFK